MNEQVFTITTSACAVSLVISTPSFSSVPTITSESTRFLAQPREIKPTRTGGSMECCFIKDRSPYVRETPGATVPAWHPARKRLPSRCRERMLAGQVVVWETRNMDGSKCRKPLVGSRPVAVKCRHERDRTILARQRHRGPPAPARAGTEGVQIGRAH